MRTFRSALFCTVLVGVVLVGVVLVGAGAASAASIHFCFAEWLPRTAMVDGVPSGPTIELMRLASQRAGFEPEFEQLPWARCLAETQAGRFDAALDGNPERGEFLHGRNSVTDVAILFWVRQDSRHLRFTGYDQFAGETIGYVHGSNYVLAAMRALQGQLVETPSSDSLVAMVAAGRVDAMLGDLVGITTLARKLHADLRPLQPAAAHTAYFPLFNHNRADLLAAIDKALGGLIADGTVDRVYRRWIGTALGPS